MTKKPTGAEDYDVTFYQRGHGFEVSRPLKPADFREVQPVGEPTAPTKSKEVVRK